jgi:hypothetical protein
MVGAGQLSRGNCGRELTHKPRGTVSRDQGGSHPEAGSKTLGCSRDIALGPLRRLDRSLCGPGGCVSQTPGLQNPILRFLPAFG